MTTVRQIVTDALRESGIIPVGETPEADEHEEAVRRLNTLIQSFLGNELGDPYLNYSYGKSGLTNQYATALDAASLFDTTFLPANSRVVFNIDESVTVYLDPNPQDGARLQIIDNLDNFATYPVTVNANGRQIESAASVTLSVDGTNSEWFYRADLGDWVLVSELTDDSDSPFPGAFDDMLVTMLAIRLNPRYGVETREETNAMMSRVRAQFKARYKQVVIVGSEEGLLRLPSGKRHYYHNEDAFSYGR